MRFAHVREVALALLAFVVGAITTSCLHAAGHDPFQTVDGDVWLTSNADHSSGKWLSPNGGRPAFGLQLEERNDLPFDRGTAGAAFWVHHPGCSGFDTYGASCGWQLGLAVTQFRSVVIGGHGIEIDGLAQHGPYTRVVDSNQKGSHLAGMLTNTFVDFSGVDSATAPSWFDGFDLRHDAFTIRRATPGTRSFSEMVRVDRSGDATFSGSVASAQAHQKAPNQWATRARLVNGTYTFRFAARFGHVPVCVATPEGAARLRVSSSDATCVVTSDDPHDASTINIVAIGNPD